MSWKDQFDSYVQNFDEADDVAPDSARQPSGANVSSTAPTASSADTDREFSFDRTQPSGPTCSPGLQQPKPRPRHTGRKILLWFIVIVLIVGGGAFWMRYLNPYTVDSLVSGYVTNVEKRGLFFKTYEGEMVTESMTADPSGSPYRQTLHFSIPSPELALRLQSVQGTGSKVTLTTEKFYGVLPWRGASNVVATSAKID